MKSVYVFPGQGSQHKGMGTGLFEKFPELVAQADDVLGYSIEDLCLRDPDRVLSQTQYTQPALYVVNSLTYLDRTTERGELPTVVAGHSLGEYCALFAAGAFDFATGLRLVAKRGELMSQAPKGAMAAVVNLDQGRVREILSGLPFRNVDIANINSRKQCILSGEYDEIHAPELRAAYTEAGARFIPLNVSAAFHSRCMTAVQQEFALYLVGFDLAELTLPVVANYTARPYPTKGYADCLAHQISSPVRWYESMSWLIAQGHRDFHEIGPGNVLTKLSAQILKDPLPVEADTEPQEVSAAVRARPRTELVFMYGGQGTQYHQMGRGLYDTDPVFRSAMDRCDAAHRATGGTSLLDAVYDDSRKGRPLDDMLTSHAALYSIGYSLTEMLRAEGIHPDAVLGHSLGEYIAATVAGAMSFEDGLRFVTSQARLLKERCPDGGMLSVLHSPDLFRMRRDLFDDIALAAVNYDRNFVVSGAEARLADLQQALDAEGVITVRLPVRHAFHSALLDTIRPDCLSLARGITPGTPRLPVHSSMLAARLGTPQRWDEYLWDVIRRPVRFDELMASEFTMPDHHFFVDLSASGSFANFLKHGYAPAFRGAPAINQFGNNTGTVRKLRDELLRLPCA
ncbi:ACP S-malonyltransferase [Sphaerisporangium sp. NPDC049002]|uniref:ACP S-malonyltransferase n=1 Tax=unclassified Sphaerisporangium TaxID=2630420 RepID=UPI0033D81599